jgi:cytochrome P450
VTTANTTHWTPSEEAAAAYRDRLDPYPYYAEARRSAPVREVLPGDIEAEGVGALSLANGRKAFALFRGDDIDAVMKDADTFSSRIYTEIMTWGDALLGMDAPRHPMYRALVSRAFSRKSLGAWYDEVIPPVINRLVDAFSGRGRADLVSELTGRFPFEVIAMLMGIPPGDHDAFREWTMAVVNAWMEPEASLAANEKIREYFAPILGARRAEPVDDLLSQLVTAQVDGRGLDDEEIDAFIISLFSAGSDTTYYSSSNLFHSLLTHPEQFEAVLADRALIPQAVEESLRWQTGGPLYNLRRVTRDTQMGGVDIPAGADVILMFASQHRDQDRYTDPDNFDIHRSEGRRGTFGSGPHTCLGNHLARMEMATALSICMDRLPGLRLDPAQDVPPVEGVVWRGPASLPVIFDVGA